MSCKHHISFLQSNFPKNVVSEISRSFKGWPSFCSFSKHSHAASVQQLAVLSTNITAFQRDIWDVHTQTQTQAATHTHSHRERVKRAPRPSDLRKNGLNGCCLLLHQCVQMCMGVSVCVCVWLWCLSRIVLYKTPASTHWIVLRHYYAALLATNLIIVSILIIFMIIFLLPVDQKHISFVIFPCYQQSLFLF